ncbi:MAG: hypothetical protein BAJALOKI3v1_810017 [Promethearchaeota archaeon]|nr:MAG: hypothetical protein BAJALOKI3v1_810017 [Candidatus Lokiarchaeota archaeon]
MEKKGTIIGLIAVILALGGLGLASYNIFVPQGQLDDNPQYFCYSSTEVQNAIDEIGSGAGVIIIAQDITLSDTIDIDQGGDYIIQGNGAITISCGGNRTAFRVSDMETLTIQNLKIDASNLSTPTLNIININDENDNPVIIENVQIHGIGLGNGIEIRSDNVWVKDCHLNALDKGIRLNESSHNCITGNIIENLSGSVDGRGIILTGAANNTIIGNIIDNINGDDDGIGIYVLDANYNAITDNIISNLDGNDDAMGIFVSDSAYNTFDGNRFNNYNSGNDIYGVWLAIRSDYNTFNDNTFSNFNPTDDSFGIICNGNYNTISGNVIDNLDGGSARGIYMQDDYNAILSNVISDVQATSSTGYGIHMDSNADYNTVIGNILTFISNTEILDQGTGNEVVNNI